MSALISPRDAGGAGFSTLETIVAFVVLSIALAMTVEAIALARLSIARAGRDEAAGRILRRVIAEELPALVEAAADEGARREGPGWRIELATVAGRGFAGARRIVIRVAPDGERFSHSYVTFVGATVSGP